MTKTSAWISKHKFWVVVLFFAIALLVFHLFTLMRWPTVFVDEAWNANRAWGFLETGIPFGTMDYDRIKDFPGYEHYFPIIPVLIQAAVMKTIHYPDLIALRLTSFFFGIALLLAVFTIGKSINGIKGGVISFFLVGTSMWFYYSGHLARTDIFAAAFGFWAVALALRANSNDPWKNLVAGLLAGVAVEIHPLGIVYSPIILTVRLIQDGWVGVKNQGFWMMSIGLAIGAITYLMLHILPAYPTYFEISQLVFSATHRPPILSGDFRIILKALGDYPSYLLHAAPFQVGLGLVGLVFILFSSGIHNKKKIILFTLVLVPLLVMPLWSRLYFAYNLILVTPLVDVIVAIMLSQLSWQYVRNHFGLKIFSGVIVGIVIAGYFLFVPVLFLRVNYWDPFVSTLAKVQVYIRPEDSIMGDQIFWFGAYENSFDGWEELVYYHENTPNSTWEDALAYFHPDIFILDSWVLSFINDQSKESELYKRLWIPLDEFEKALRNHGSVIAEIDGGVYGYVSLYQLTWP